MTALLATRLEKELRHVACVESSFQIELYFRVLSLSLFSFRLLSLGGFCRGAYQTLSFVQNPVHSELERGEGPKRDPKLTRAR